VCAVEIEEYPRKVLLQRQLDGILPKFPIWDDITTFDGRPWKGVVDVVCGGFPCQDISCAGKGTGIEGERSGLWVEMSRVINEIRPRYVFVENSPMLTSRGLGRVLGDLAEMGYNAKWGVLGADDAGAPHRRKRIWILAHAKQPGGRTHRGFNNQRWDTSKARREGIQPKDREAYSDYTGQGCKDVPYTKIEGLQRAESKRPICSNGCPPEQVELHWWSVEPELGRVADGVAHRTDRLKAIGNGQVPRVAELAWRILKD
jgi:DNA (cytosine-5)-methyltransferase 1